MMQLGPVLCKLSTDMSQSKLRSVCVMYYVDNHIPRGLKVKRLRFDWLKIADCIIPFHIYLSKESSNKQQIKK